MRITFVAIAAVVMSSLLRVAATECPPAVTAAVQKAHAGATIASCKMEQEDGKTQFDVKLQAATGKGLSLDVSPDGTILMTEQSVTVTEVPPAVMKAFAAKYGTAKATRAEMQTAADGKVTYELKFAVESKKREATFTSDGIFVEEE